MEETFIHSLSVQIANKLNKYAYKEGLEFKKVVLGAEIILINVTKLILIFSLSAIMGIFFETVMVLIGFNIIRRTAFGLHARNNIWCAITSTALFVIVPYVLRDYQINILAILFIFVTIFIALFLYAPSDTESRPIIGVNKRSKLRRDSLISCLVLLLIVLFIPFSNFKLMMTVGAVYEAISILPITYKLLKRRRKNYEEYE